MFCESISIDYLLCLPLFFICLMLIDNYYSISYNLRESFTYLFRENFADDMKVNRFVYFDKNDVEKSFNGRDLIEREESQNLFLDLYYKDKDKCVKNIAFYNFGRESLTKFYVDNNINFQISKIVAKKQYNKDVLFALLLDNRDNGVFDIAYSSNYNVRIKPLSAGVYSLSDFKSDLLSKISVKRIVADIPNCYITLKADNQRVANNIPCSLLKLDFKNEEVFFNNYKINIYESFITLLENTDKYYNINFLY